MAPRSVLIKNAAAVVTMDAARRELADASVLIEGGVITAVGDAPGGVRPDETFDARGCVVTPGLVNTHHHLFQTLVRAVPQGQDAPLFGWLRSLYPVFARMTPDDIFVSAQLGLAEMALSGCTMSSDHLYLYVNGVRLEDTIEAAATVGVRFHPARGAMSIGESGGGLPPDSVVEKERDIINDFIRVADAFHDPAPGAMVRIALAPCSPFTVSEGVMRDAAGIARDKSVMLHTHLAENDEDIEYSLANYGRRPGRYAEDLGWTGDRVWHAHCVKLDESEIDLFARTKTGVAHCPCSNGRLGSGIAPVRRMLDAGVPLGLGVDGSASNDSGHLLAEARQAMLMQRAHLGAQAMSAREALEAATLGGAQVLGRGDDLGSLEPGKRADIAVWDTSGLETAGAWDPVAALVLCGPLKARDVLAEGRFIVRSGALTGVDAETIVRRARERVAYLRG